MTHTPLEQELLAVLESALPLVIHAYRLQHAPAATMGYTFSVLMPAGEMKPDDIYQQLVDAFGEPPIVTRIRAALAKARGTD